MEKETRFFQSEVKQLLHLMIHSLYSNKEIFLRELISNAFDAVDKLRFLSISSPEIYDKNDVLKVRISVDKINKIIVIDDNGIGMTKNEVIENLGTIAKSGTKSFIEFFSKNQIKNNNLIGQFGVGFYSSFIVSKKVTVFTRAAGKKIEDGVFWESSGEGEYTISSIEKEDRGTKIILYLREEEEEFLNEWKLKNIVKKYSDHIDLPVEMQFQKENTKEFYWKQINQAKSIWTRNKSEISPEKYKEFYKNISGDSKDPLTWSHNFVEGKQEYISLLYIPEETPFNFWNQDYQYGLKLYVQRIFIMENSSEFLPNYLRFVRGIIDSNDLPLNISRELLQSNQIVQKIKNSITQRILKMLETISIQFPKKYIKFWKQFGLIFKEGPAEDIKNLDKISKLLRFISTKSNSENDFISLEEYDRRTKKNQKEIYYVTADNYISAKNSPHLEFFYKENVEVLLLFDRIDEWMITHIKNFKNKSFQSVSKKDLSLNNSSKNILKNDISEESLKNFIKSIKDILGDKVKEVRISNRLTNSPSVVVTEEKDISTQMEKLLLAAGHHNFPKIKYLLEINPYHPLVKKIIKEKNSNYFSNWVEILFNQALLREKGTLKDLGNFVHNMNKLLLL